MADLANGTGLGHLTEPARNRYFFGKLLDATNLEREQAYVNRKRWLLNRLGLGAGVMCGLDVVVANDGRRIVVRPGVAVDGFGREIVVPADSPPVDPRRPTDEHGQSAATALSGAATVTICLAYHECPADPVRALVPDCDTVNGCEAGTIRERYAIVVRHETPPAVARPTRLSGLFAEPADQVLPTLAARVAGVCAEPAASACVVLARVDLPAAETDAPTVETASVRPVVYSNALLLELILSLAERVDECCQNHP